MATFNFSTPPSYHKHYKCQLLILFCLKYLLRCKMARILYSVAGEGMGHSVRSGVLIQKLAARHKVKVVAGGKAYPYIKRFFPDTYKISSIRLICLRNRLIMPLTIIANIIKFPVLIKRAWKIKSIIKKFKPDIVISDFE